MLFSFLKAGFHAASLVNQHAGGPLVNLSYATLEGNSTGGIDRFLGIPYAQPPLGNLRFRRPQPPLSSPGITLVSDLMALDPDRCLIARRPQRMETVV